MTTLLDWTIYVAMAGTFLLGLFTFWLLRKRKVTIKDKPLSIAEQLGEFVTLDSYGWKVVYTFGAIGALVMIVSSAAIGIAYWTGLAIDGDIAGGVIEVKEGEDLGLFDVITVGVVAFFVLALILELFSDLGVPLASGLSGRKKTLLAQLVVAATAGCIFMSLVTKWGYYDDKREFRETQQERQVEADTQWHRKSRAAAATIERLNGTASQAVATAKRDTAETTITELKAQIEDAQKARDAIPETHSTNRLRAQEIINELNRDLRAQELIKVEAVQIIADREELDKALADQALADAEILKLVGSTEDNGSVRVAAGDVTAVRVFRVGIHQFLCWLFPIIFFEGRAAYRDVKKKEEANEKRRATMEDKKNTVDADFTEAPAQAAPVEIEVGQEYYDERTDREAAEVAAMLQERENDPDVERAGEADDTEGTS